MQKLAFVNKCTNELRGFRMLQVKSANTIARFLASLTVGKVILMNFASVMSGSIRTLLSISLRFTTVDYSYVVAVSETMCMSDMTLLRNLGAFYLLEFLVFPCNPKLKLPFGTSALAFY